MKVSYIDLPLSSAPHDETIIWVKVNNEGHEYATLAYRKGHDWISTSDGQALVGVTHWAPMS